MLETLPSKLHARVAAHYERIAPLLTRSFGTIPFVYASFPDGFGRPPIWHGPMRTPGAASHTIDVTTHAGTYPYRALSEPEIATVVRHAGAIELHSWTPIPADPNRARFGRILLELCHVAPPPQPGHSELPEERRQTLRSAAFCLRDLLLELTGLSAIPLLAGNNGIAFYIPLAGGPAYKPLRASLDALCEEAARRNPRLLTTEPNSHADARVHLHPSSNAVGRFSALPYSLRGDEALHVCAPVSWEELAHIAIDAFTAGTFADRLAAAGDLFAAQAEAIGQQSLPNNATIAAGQQHHAKAVEPHGHVLRAVLEILEDGKPRDAGQILSEAIACGLLPPSTLRKYVYTSLLEYIVRTSGHGHRPAIVQDPDRRFRINQPPDPWPAVPSPEAPALSPATQALIDRLETTARANDPANFELAVCDAFAHLGFAATHVGGNDNPDGYADAQLGVLGYRVMLECKTAGDNSDVHNPDAVEASKFRDAYRAQYCAMIGPSFAESVELASELQTHSVSAWTAGDLSRLLTIGSDPCEMRPLFAPGFAADALDTLLWNRLHGESKRVALVCDYLQTAGWAEQVAAAKQGTPQDAPRLNEDAAMILVDQQLAAAGSNASCTRTEIQAAFEYLTNPRVAIATWTDENRESVVICRTKA